MGPTKVRRDTRRRLLQGAAGKVYDLTEALIRRSCGDSDIEAVLGGNFGRLLVSVWNPEPVTSTEGTSS